jgi:hypothetical protein
MNTKEKPLSAYIIASTNLKYSNENESVKKNPKEKNPENSIESVNNEEDISEVQKTVQTNKNRCFSCNKKVGYTGLPCRCDYIFCGNCRYPEKHSCTFDFKTHGRKILEKQNQKIVNHNFEKI